MLKIIPPKLVTVNYKKQTQIHISQIIMLEAAGNYTIFHLQNGQSKLYAKCISSFEETLCQEGFLRVHRAYIINPKFIIDYDNGSSQILMFNKLIALVSRRKRQVL
jgi:DNA-binding LytR/AlgR family response regulator